MKKLYVLYSKIPSCVEHTIYGYSYSKNVIKAFLSQRCEDKYIVKVIDNDESIEEFICNISDDPQLPKRIEIDYISLYSSSRVGDKIKFFTTPDELVMAEHDIRKMFQDRCSLSENIPDLEDKDTMYYVTLINNIQQKYLDALDYIGFNPPEFDIFDSPCDCDEYYDNIEIENMRNSFYGNNDVDNSKSADGLKCIYSLEMFIKVLKEYM